MLIAASLAITPTVAGALGVAHSLAHPCGALHDVPHGVAVAINLPAVIEFNAAGGADIAARYRDVAAVLGLDDAIDAAAALAARVRELTAALGLPTRLSQVGVAESSLPDLVAAALGDACTLVNPREPSAEDLAALYRRAL
jgi:alcohol dehydrogenase class IV